MNRRQFTKLMAAAVAGVVAGTGAASAQHNSWDKNDGKAKEKSKDSCEGKDGCKGKDGCGGKDGCKGKDGCGGK